MEEWLHRRQRLSNHGIITWPPPPPLWRLEPTERQGTWAWSFSSCLSFLFCDILWQLETTCDSHVFRVELLLRTGGRRTYHLSYHQKLIPSVASHSLGFAEANAAPEIPRFQRRDSTQRRGSSVICQHENIGEQMDYIDNIDRYTFIYVCICILYYIILYYIILYYIILYYIILYYYLMRFFLFMQTGIVRLSISGHPTSPSLLPKTQVFGVNFQVTDHGQIFGVLAGRKSL